MLIKGVVSRLKRALSPKFTMHRFSIDEKTLDQLLTGKPFDFKDKEFKMKRLINSGKAVLVVNKKTELTSKKNADKKKGNGK